MYVNILIFYYTLDYQFRHVHVYIFSCIFCMKHYYYILRHYLESYTKKKSFFIMNKHPI